MPNLAYYQRVFAAYLGKGPSQLTFWHDAPEPNANLQVDVLGEYYMPFLAKADYSRYLDEKGVPLLDYRGSVGLQYNPIAIAQYGLGNYNAFRRTAERERELRFLAIADWLCDHLELNPHGLPVWMHHFDWEYRDTLRAPWYSGLAQGQGISVLVRAYEHTRDSRYLDAAQNAFRSFKVTTDQGGVVFIDRNGRTWLEEYIVFPPTHILNGFIWGSWGIYDLWLVTRDPAVKRLFDSLMDTLRHELHTFDVGFWSLYEQSGTLLKMLASGFYHRLHIAQLHVLHRLTGDVVFRDVAMRWESYDRSPLKRKRALAQKAIFKLCYY
jgi:hypothetical protein